MHFGELDAFGKRFNAVAVRAGADAAGWSATVSGKEFAGELNYRGAAGGKLVARLERLSIPEDSPAKPAAPGAPPVAAKQADLPAVDLVAEEFVFEGKALGRVEVQAQRVGGD